MNNIHVNDENVFSNPGTKSPRPFHTASVNGWGNAFIPAIWRCGNNAYQKPIDVKPLLNQASSTSSCERLSSSLRLLLLLRAWLLLQWERKMLDWEHGEEHTSQV